MGDGNRTVQFHHEQIAARMKEQEIQDQMAAKELMRANARGSTRMSEASVKEVGRPEFRGSQVVPREEKTLLNFADVANATQFSEDIGSHGARIPWYIIDPTGDVARKQRRDDRMRRAHDRAARKVDMDGDGMISANELIEASRRSKQEATTATAVVDSAVRSTLRRFGGPCIHNGRFEWPTLYPAWDAVAGIALIVTAATTPFEIGFLPPAESATEPLFLLNRVIDAIFLIDVIFQFFLMYPKRTAGSFEESGAGAYEMRLGEIAKQYIIRGPFFAIDVLSLIPSIFDIIPVVQDQSNSSPKALKTLRIIRVLRLFKLLRLLRASKMLNRLIDRISWSVKSVRLLQLLFITLLMAHMYGCILAIITTLAESPLDSWLATTGYCTPDPAADTDDERGYVCVDEWWRYQTCLWWGTGLLTAAQHEPFPPGPFEPHFSNSSRGIIFSAGEAAAVQAMQLVGMFIWTFIFGTLIATLSHSDPAAVAFDIALDNLNTFCRHYHVPGEQAREMRHFLHETRHEQYERLKLDVYGMLSPGLQEKVSMKLNGTWLLRTKTFGILARWHYGGLRWEILGDVSRTSYLKKRGVEIAHAELRPEMFEAIGSLSWKSWRQIAEPPKDGERIGAEDDDDGCVVLADRLSHKLKTDIHLGSRHDVVLTEEGFTVTFAQSELEDLEYFVKFPLKRSHYIEIDLHEKTAKSLREESVRKSKSGDDDDLPEGLERESENDESGSRSSEMKLKRTNTTVLSDVTTGIGEMAGAATQMIGSASSLLTGGLFESSGRDAAETTKAYFQPFKRRLDFTPAEFHAFDPTLKHLTVMHYVKLADGRVARPLRSEVGPFKFNVQDQEIAEGFVSALSLKMQVSTFTPRDHPPGGRLYMITQGAVLYKSNETLGSQMLGAEDCWGVDALVLQTSSTMQAMAVTFVHVLWIDRETYEGIAAQFPTAARALKVPALWGALRAGWRKAWLMEAKPAPPARNIGRGAAPVLPLQTAPPDLSKFSREALLQTVLNATQQLQNLGAAEDHNSERRPNQPVRSNIFASMGAPLSA